MALKIFEFVSAGTSGNFYTNNSNSFVLIVGWNADYESATLEGFIQLVDPEGNAVDRVLFIKPFQNSDSVSEQGNFSTTASTSTGITSTTDNISGTIERYSQVFVVRQKMLVPPKFSLEALSMTVYGFLAIQADSLEELRGFL